MAEAPEKGSRDQSVVKREMFSCDCDKGRKQLIGLSLAHLIVLGGDCMDLGKRLKTLRGNRSRALVANDLGISSSALGMYESNNRVPRDPIKKKIAEYYGVTIQQLFFDEESPTIGD